MSTALANKKSLHVSTPNTPVEAKLVKELVNRFSEVQEELKISMAEVTELNDSEVETGFWRGLRGKTDAQIAKHVKQLGMNLHTTQKIVMFLIELSHAKNEVLRTFHSKLVEKLIEFDKEHDNIAGDLTASQKNERKIVYKIKEQVEQQLELRDDIDTNAYNIGENREFLESNRSDISENKGQIQSNSSDISENKGQIQSNISDISENQEQIAENLDSISRNSLLIEQNTKTVDALQKRLSEISNALVAKDKADEKQAALFASQQHAIDELTQQLYALQQGTTGEILSSKKLIHLYGVISVAALALASYAAGFIPM